MHKEYKIFIYFLDQKISLQKQWIDPTQVFSKVGHTVEKQRFVVCQKDPKLRWP